MNEDGKNQPEPDVVPEVDFDEDDPVEAYDVEFSIFGPGGEAEQGTKGPPTLAGRYQLIELLGGGAMGEVWKARDIEQGDDVAVKIIKEGLGSKDFEERFWREARVLTRVRHPNVLEIRDYGSAPKPFLVMELLKGQDLAQLIARFRRLPLARAADIFKQACDGLAHVHEAGVIHRDLKPANIFYTEGGVVKLVDFGLAKRKHPLANDVDADSSDGATLEKFATRAGTMVGTLKYMSPEQMSRGTVDFRTDLWSLSIVLFKMLTGKNAFEGETEIDLMLSILQGRTPTPVSIVRDLPPKLNNFFERALQKKPENRFSSATDMASALSIIVDQATRRA